MIRLHKGMFKPAVFRLLLTLILCAAVVGPVILSVSSVFAADIAVDSSVFTFHGRGALGRGGPFWTTTLIGYVIYLDADQTLVYSKTIDGGATWAAANNLAGVTVAFDCWADWQTAGDAGTKIHIACTDSTSDTIKYISLDTSTDAEASDTIEACQGSGVIYVTTSQTYHQISITKTRGGNIAVAARYADDTHISYYIFYTSPDGDTWTSKTSPWEAAIDQIQLYPANLADNQDLWAAFWDISANIISLKTFDNSANSWAETTIAASMVESATYLQMGGAIRLSDGHLIFAAWSAFDSATADLRVWDITNAESMAEKANVKTDTAEYFLTSVFINQLNSDIYVAYLGGTVALATVDALYKKSTDGGTTWGGETILSDDAMDNHQWISAGAVKSTWGGRFEPIWFDDDDDDLFTTFVNSVELAVVVAPTIQTNAASSVTSSTARLNGQITATGNENPSVLMYWGDNDGGTTENNWDNKNLVPDSPSQPQGVAAFYLDISGLSPKTLYYFSAKGTNSAGSTWASTTQFTTLAASPTITLSAATLVEDTTARLNGEVTATGGENPTVTVYWGTTDHPGTADGWDHSAAPTSPGQPQGVAAFYYNASGLDPNTKYYFTAKATNSGGTDWPPASLDFTTTYTLSIDLDNNDFTVGIIRASSSANTGLDYYAVTNDGNVLEDISIHGHDLTGAAKTWTLSDDGDPGDAIYGLKAGLEGESYNIVVKKNTEYYDLVAGLGVSGTQIFGLELYSPSSNIGNVAMSGTVTLTASLHV